MPTSTIEEIAAVLRSGEPTALLMGGSTMFEAGLVAASRVSAASGAKLLAETFPARLERGAGLPSVERLGYLAEFAQAQMDGLSHLVLVDALSPVSFFAYPDKASDLVPEGCTVHMLAAPGDDATAALAGAGRPAGRRARRGHARTGVPAGPAHRAAQRRDLRRGGRRLAPGGGDRRRRGQHRGLFVSGFTAGAPRHDWLCLPGGAIGYGMPVATGAAIACPDRKVVNLQADGSAMYTIQSLWTQVREGLDVTTIILNNRSYAILNLELSRVGADPGPKALEMLDLTNPELDFVSIATGMGVRATRATTAEEFTEQLEAALSTPGPNLVEAMLPPTL